MNLGSSSIDRILEDVYIIYVGWEDLQKGDTFSIFWFIPKIAATSKAELIQIEEQGVSSRSPCWCRVSRLLAILHSLPSWKLDGDWNFWDMSQYTYAILEFQGRELAHWATAAAQAISNKFKDWITPNLVFLFWGWLSLWLFFLDSIGKLLINADVSKNCFWYWKIMISDAILW